MTRLVDAGIVSPRTADRTSTTASSQNSVVVFVTRPGNPEGIESWDDLVTGDVEVITPNPFTSGGARWNLMAAYGSQIEPGQVRGGGARVRRRGAREHAGPGRERPRRAADVRRRQGRRPALLRERGDRGAARRARSSSTSIPDETILIETPAAVTEEADDPEAAQAFLDFLYSDEGQQLFGESGYRPVDEKVLAEYKDEFPTPKDLFTIEEFGGWDKVADEFFDPENGSVAEIERELGVATE